MRKYIFRKVKFWIGLSLLVEPCVGRLRALSPLVARVGRLSNWELANGSTEPKNKSRQYNFGSAYDIDFKPTSGFELIDENWKVENWIKMNGDKERFNGCKAFQKVLDSKFLIKN